MKSITTAAAGAADVGYYTVDVTVINYRRLSWLSSRMVASRVLMTQ